jgi:ABC-type uncharacterized transport system involved in gliding motility auxiliary subunit
LYHSARTKWQLRFVNFSFIVLFLVAVGLLQWLSREYQMRIDLTQSARHSLSAASIAVVERLEEPLTVTAFVSKRGEVRESVRNLVARYQKHKANIELEFVDPDETPQRVRDAGVKYEGELVLTYVDATENLSPTALNEEGLTNALTRLAQRGERWIVFLGAHGERSPDRQANFDLSTWATQLRKRGFKLRTLSLAEHPQIPHNTTLLVIAGPRTRILPGEAKQIERFVLDGGNLLWMNDPGPLNGLESLAEALGVEFLSGVIVDPESEIITNNANTIVVSNYGSHPIVKNFTDITVFPHASALSFKAPIGWVATPLVVTRPRAWSETGNVPGRLKFDKGADVEGPLTLGVALTHDLEETSPGDQKRQQRVVIIGDGDFLSNNFLGHGANLDLGIGLVNWLTQNDAYVSIPVHTAPDRVLKLSRAAQILIATGFMLIIPLLLVGSGIAVWVRRRKL